MAKLNQPSILMFEAAYPPPVIGGKEKQAHLLAKTLLGKNVRVKALSYAHNAYASNFHEGVFVERVKKGWMAAIKIAIVLLRNRKSFSILHVHTPSNIGKLVVLCGFLLRYRVVFKFPNQHLLDTTNRLSRFVWSGLFLITDLFVVLEEDTKNKLQHRGVSDRKVFYVENGVQIGEALELISRRHIRLLFVGRLVSVKACDQLLRACALLRGSGVEFSLYVVGDGPLRSQLISLARKLRLSECVSFGGYHPIPLEQMKQSDVLVLPSLKEGMSNVILEAVSIGLPVIATDVGAAKKLVGPYGEQFLCQPSDPACLAEKIQLLANNPDLRKKYSTYLYNRGRDTFSIDVIAEKYMKKYSALCAPEDV
ncbi:glycosyltransferase [Spiribacter sp. C176]|uniref:Glycosyltransferase n=1 Tax=Spiribacter salilacus TaxID=2664894 RepID=A0A6N7QSD8_9GAMM|nr:glycosyltransferase family 4 protein [Spiribacter salilacus]MRH78510.1 glycosyltransferase [Spiribacter salilacus]